MRLGVDGDFCFERDTFSFANELVWQYEFDPKTGTLSTFRTTPAPTYFHRCFVMVRAARQFLDHARFDTALAPVDEGVYRALIRQTVRRNPRQASSLSSRVVIPGYAGLRALSERHAPLLRAECGGPWDGYFLRSHWRMVFPIWTGHQSRMARQLQRSLTHHRNPIIHVFRFPHITINHGILLYDSEESDRSIRFQAYDPNIPEHPTELTYDRTLKTFVYPRNFYWAGGAVKVVETFRGGLY